MTTEPAASPPEAGTIAWHWPSRFLDGVDTTDERRPAAGSGSVPTPSPRHVGRILHGIGWRARRIRNRIRWFRRGLGRRGLRWLHDVRTARSDPTRSILRDWLAMVRVRRSGRVVPELLSFPVRVRVADDDSSVTPLDKTCRRDAPVVEVPSSLLCPATSSPPSYWLTTDAGPVWLGAHEPHLHPPIAWTQRRVGQVTPLDDVMAGLSTRHGRRNAALVAASRLPVIDSSSTVVEAPIAARAILDLIGVGALVGADRLPEGVAALLGEQLTAAIEVVPIDRRIDGHDLDRWSVVQRRLVHRQHSVYRALASVTELVDRPVAADPSVSVIMATNRPDMVPFAVEQIARQHCDEIELLIGLHCVALPAPVRSQVAELVPDAQIVSFDGDQDLGGVLDALARRASGTLLTKWDDDDWYASHHVTDLIDAMRYSGATLVGKAAEYIHLSALDITIRRFATGAERFSTTIAGGTLMVGRSVLSDLGGWPAGPKRVDRLLIDRVGQARGTVYRLHGDGYLLRRSPDPSSHTWQAGDSYFLGQAVDQRPGLDFDFAGIDRPTTPTSGRLESVR